MSATNFNTRNSTYRQLMGNGLVYRIPRFQRDYSWGEDEWDDLWQDILGTIEPDGEPAHYMGYLVLQTSDDKNFEVIDGQQRLTTLSLIVLAGMRVLKRLSESGHDSDDNRQRLEQLRVSYIGYLDPVTLIPRSKLTLNRNNNGYYQHHLVPLEEQLPKRGFPASVHAMRKAFEWFERHMQEYIKDKDNPDKSVAQFIEAMSDKLFFTVITVADELNAYKVFETLNARGVRLSATDLLKNYLFSVLARDEEDPHEMDEMESRWESMVDRLGGGSLPDFMRMHWNSRQAFARQAGLFKVIRARVNIRKDVFSLLRNMDEDIDTYLALTQPDGSHWLPELREQSQQLRMFNVRQPFPMLMAAKRKLSDNDFKTLLQAAVVLSFRYNVIGAQHTGEQERVYHRIATQIEREELANINHILDALKPVYPNDESFRVSFAEKSIKTTASRNAKIVRYILCRLEKQESGQDFDFDSSSYTIEHILPQSPDNGLENFHDRDLDALIYRLGNMVMLEAGKNKDIGNAHYNQKRDVLAKSTFALTRQLAEKNETWTPKGIGVRQKKLANIATSVWRIAQIS